MSRYDNLDDHFEQITVPVSLGLDSWAWVLSMLIDNDEVTKRIRAEINRHPAVASSRVLTELLKK
jgi:hypothetical protein